MHFSAEKQRELLEDWKNNGNAQSLNDLIMSNKRLVMKEANSLVKGNKNISLEDLIQEGYLGLTIAVEKFDLSQDNNFVTYAMFWIRQRIKAYIVSNRSMVRLGTTSDNRKIFSSLPAVLRDMEDEEMTKQEKLEEASKILGVKKASLYSMVNILNGYDKSFDQKISDSDEGSSNTLLDVTADEKDYEMFIENNDGMEKFAVAIISILENDLTEEEAFVVKCRFLKDDKETYDEIAKKMRVSRQYVRSREAFALKKIKSKMRLRFGLSKVDFFS